jgi:pyruvate dehydrogenase E2 component (dihydrolipoamide acetyltransferase)
MDEGVFAGWLKPDGAPVRAGEAVFLLESEKATEQIECLESGVLRIPPNGPREGDRVAVGAVIGYLVQPEEAAPFERGSAPPAPAPPPTAAREEEAVRPAISPRAKRVALELGVDWARLRGGGRTGRIRERDVRAAASRAEATSGSRGVPSGDSRLRKTIAQRLLTSCRSTAAVTLTTTVDATNLVNLREQFRAVERAGGDPAPSYTDFLVKLSAVALQKHPRFNLGRVEEGTRAADDVHIGIAVDADAGLLVPVIHGVQSLTLKQVAGQARDLIERARQGRLTAAEMQRGTFTVTNLGMYDVDAFTPIINYPQCAILGVGRIQRRPAAIDDRIVARDQLTLSLTFDHCLVDGGPAAQFLQTLSRAIENPGPWLMP